MPSCVAAALPPEHRYVYVVKGELAQQWIPRRFLEGLDAVFVERFDAKQGVEGLAQVEEAVRSGASPVFFPEGTFDRQPGLREFRLGAFLLAARTGVPVVPVGIRGARSIPARRELVSAVRRCRRCYRRTRGASRRRLDSRREVARSSPGRDSALITGTRSPELALRQPAAAHAPSRLAVTQRGRCG